jgi:uncharacterized membrane protein
MVMSAQPVDPQAVVNEREWEQPANWSGWFGAYSSRLDNRLWVPKRPMTGTGQALHFGDPGARTLIVGMCIVPAALLLVLFLMRFAQ